MNSACLSGRRFLISTFQEAYCPVLDTAAEEKPAPIIIRAEAGALELVSNRRQNSSGEFEVSED